MDKSWLPKCAAEFIGTFILAFTIGCNLLSTGTHTFAVISIACSSMVGIYSLSPISGAHFNPAITLAVYFSNKISLFLALAYVASQILAANIAALIFTCLYSESASIGPGPGYSPNVALEVECLYTFMLCFVVLNVSAKVNPGEMKQYSGMAIAFVFIAGGYAAGAISGAAFNPAVTIALDVSAGSSSEFYSIRWVCAQLLGGLLSAVFFFLLRPEQYTRPASIWSPFLAELIGTFFLTLTVGLNVTTSGTAPALSIAASLMCMIYAVGDISGGHFNPAVTLAVFMCRRDKITGTRVFVYISAQLIGALIGAITYTLIAGHSFALAPGVAVSWLSAGLAEGLFTFVLCFVVLAVCTTEKGLARHGELTDFYGFAIGMCVTVGGFAVGPLSGASMNPALSFAIDTSNAFKGGAWRNCVAYSAFEILGACLASYIIRLTHPKEFYPKIRE